jgi:uncharacterized protein YyaL (SSP411 family)
MALPPSALPSLNWVGWSDTVFEQARGEKHFVLLDLEAVWCHWCHVMAETTYKDPEVVQLLQKHFLTVRVDQDSRPDLSNRYENYGWPATVVFDAKGNEIIKRSGYLPPKQMASILKAIIKDPTPGPSVFSEEVIENLETAITPALRMELEKTYFDGYDSKEGAWGKGHKFLDANSVELAMLKAKQGDKRAEKMVSMTLEGEAHLIDPVWGGVYQYSTDGVWTNPHFEKIMSMQAENLRIFAMGYTLSKDTDTLRQAHNIYRYLTDFMLSPSGAFYTSQDADVVEGQHSAEYFALSDIERRKQGVPRIDTHVYARENGWAVTGIVALYAATGDKRMLQNARRAIAWVEANRQFAEGGFSHDAKDASGPYLGDSISMARAYLALYTATADRHYLAQAQQTLLYVGRTFRGPKGIGYLTSKTNTDRLYAVQPQRDENVWVARCANLLFHYTGNKDFQNIAEQAMRFLSSPNVAERLPVANALLVDHELSRAPLHITIVGRKDDAVAQSLFQAALQYPVAYKRLEWWDVREGRLPNPDVQYPESDKAAAFICTNRTCSLPIFEQTLLTRRLDVLTDVM